MKKNGSNQEVDHFFREAGQWRPEFEKLRKIALACPLTEELKWGKPCYHFEGNNVILINGFKEYCALMFCKGVLLKDPHKILVQQTENVQAARQARFVSVSEITQQASILKAYIEEAIELEKSGVKVEYRKNTDLVFPEEFQKKLAENGALKTAFQKLTPGRQRGYHLYFSGAKQSRTREARVEKCVPLILKGKGPG